MQVIFESSFRVTTLPTGAPNVRKEDPPTTRIHQCLLEARGIHARTQDRAVIAEMLQCILDDLNGIKIEFHDDPLEKIDPEGVIFFSRPTDSQRYFPFQFWTLAWDDRFSDD